MNEEQAKQVLGQLLAALPAVHDWIDDYLEEYVSVAVPVVALGFSRLPQYFDQRRLSTSKAVRVDRVQVPPLSKMGFPYFAEFERTAFGGITYKDTLFLAPMAHHCEATYFHELVHVIQWDVLGAETFLMVYGLGLFEFGYENSPLERMAYELQAAFEHALPIPKLDQRVGEKTVEVAKAFG